MWVFLPVDAGKAEQEADQWLGTESDLKVTWNEAPRGKLAESACVFICQKMV